MIGWIPPALLLGVLLCAGYASLFHLWGGSSLRDLAIYLLVALLGFGVGQFVGLFTRIPLLQIGYLHVLEGTLGAWLGLIGVRLLSHPPPRAGG